MKISVVTPVYNAENHLDKCIHSILNQSFTNFELILINDGSTDKSGVICDDYAKKDNRIKVFHQENGGPSVARNKGIEKMQGDCVTFIDADDYVDKSYLEAFMPPDIDPKKCIVMQGYKMELGNGEVEIHKFKSGFYPQSLYSELFYSGNIIRRHPFACTKLYPVDLIKENTILYNKNIKYGEDLIFLLECIKVSENVVLVEETGYNYQYNDNSLTRSLYSYESEMMRLSTVRDQLADLATKFSFDEKTISSHKRYMKRYFYRVMDSLYLHTPIKGRKERVALLRENWKNDNYELLTKYNKARTVFTIGFKFLFVNQLFNLLDLYLFLKYKAKKENYKSR